MVSLDCVKNGWDIRVTGEDTEETRQAKQELNQWFNQMDNSILDVLQPVIFDHEGIGCTGVEILREAGLGTPIQEFAHFQTTYVKLAKDGKRLQLDVKGEKVWFLLYDENYDEEGNPLSLDRYTGEWSTTPLPPEREAHEVLWWYEYQSGCNEYGMARITKALDILELEVGRSNFNIKFFENYGLPAFAVYITGQFKDEEQKHYLPDGSVNPNFDVTKTLRYRIAQQIKEVIKNPHSAVVISLPTSVGQNVDVHFVPLSTDIKEASFRMMRQDNKDDICSAHKISSDLVGVANKGALGGSVLDETLAGYNENKVQPKQRTFTNPINKLIQNEVGVTFIHDMTNVSWVLNDYMKRDIDSEVDRTLKLLDTGLITGYDAQQKLSKLCSITVDEDNEYLREYRVHDKPLWQIFNTMDEAIFDYNEYTLKHVENDLLREAERYLYDNGEHTTSRKNNAEKKIPKGLERILEKHRQRRNKIR